MACAVYETDKDALETIRQRIRSDDKFGLDVEFDFSYGFLTGIALTTPSGGVRCAISTRTDDNPRGRGLSLDGWLAALDEPLPIKITAA